MTMCSSVATEFKFKRIQYDSMFEIFEGSPGSPLFSLTSFTWQWPWVSRWDPLRPLSSDEKVKYHVPIHTWNLIFANILSPFRLTHSNIRHRSYELRRSKMKGILPGGTPSQRNFLVPSSELYVSPHREDTLQTFIEIIGIPSFKALNSSLLIQFTTYLLGAVNEEFAISALMQDFGARSLRALRLEALNRHGF